MKHNRMTALLLLTALLAASLISCGDTKDPEVTNTADTTPEDTAAVTEKLDALDARMLVDDGLGEADFGGKDFHILGVEYCEDYYIIEKETGDVLDDAVFRRNSAVMERFNVNITAEVMDYDKQPSHLKTSVLSGDDAYQLYAGHVIVSGQIVADGIYTNWYDIPNVDFSRPWWSVSNVQDLTYDGKTFLAVGDFLLSSTNNTYCIYFNKQLAADYDLPDLYEIVNNGQWTVDKLTEVSREVYRDLNGDSVSDIDDLHGFSMFIGSPVNAFLWSFGEKIAKTQPDGTIALDYYNAKTVDIYQKLYDLIWVGNTTFTLDANITDFADKIRDKFLNGKALFTQDAFFYAVDMLRDFNTDYGIIPMPKWDEAQEKYYTMVDGSHEVMAVPVTITDPEFVGTVIEALNAESYKRTIPVYYDIVLKTKGSRDEESVAIIDMICENRIFDFGYVYGAWGAAFWPQTLMQSKNADISSYYEKNHKSFDKYMEKIFTFFEEYEAE